MSPASTFRITVLSLSIIQSLSASALAEDDTSVEYIEVAGIRQPFRGDVPLNEQPQAIETLSVEQLSDAGVSDFLDALDFSAAVSRQNNFGGVWDSFAIRGFIGDENVPSGYLVNGYNAGRGFGGTRDTVNVQSIEIMKGPGSALYGRSEPGGTVNIVTKKPQFEEQGYIQATIGRWDSYRLEADYTNAVDNDLAMRVTGAWEDSGSFRNPVDSEKVVITPSLLWQVSPDTKVNYELEYVDQAVPFDRGIVVIDGNINALPVTRYLGEASDGATQIDVLAHQLSIEHTMADWILLAGINYRDTALEGYSSDPELVGGRQLLNTDGQTLSRQHNYRNFASTDLMGRIELSGNVNLAGITHHILVGLDSYHFDFDKYWERFRPTPGDTTYSINVFDPQYGSIAPEGALLNDQNETQDSTGVYLQDQIDLTDNLKVLIGGRFDHFEQTIERYTNGTISSQQHDVFSPRAGIVYTLNDSTSLYGSYAEGFRSNTGTNYQGVAFEPEESRSVEVGAKFDSQFLSGSVALFNAEKSNVLTADPVNSGYSATLGKAESQGLEVEFNASLSNNTWLRLSYAFTDAKTANDVINADWGVNIPAGSRLINIPKHAASLTLQHELTVGGKASNVGATVNYTGDRLGETIDPTYILPAYTLVNLFGTMTVAENLSVRLNVSNLFNEVYYPSSYSKLWTVPGEPRNIKVSVNYQF